MLAVSWVGLRGNERRRWGRSRIRLAATRRRYRAPAETAIRWSSRSARNPQSGVRPASSRARRARGTCRPSARARRERGDRDRRRHRLVDVEHVEALTLEGAPDAGIVRGESTMFGSVPFAGTITERPTGMMSGGGRSWRPRRGWRKRVKLPGGSLPMIVRVSTPRPRRASAWSSACSTTAPQKDQEYGTTMPTFMRKLTR